MKDALLILMIFLSLSFYSCEKNDDNPDDEIPEMYISINNDLRQINDVGLESIKISMNGLKEDSSKPAGVQFKLEIFDPEKKAIGDIASFINNGIELVISIYPQESPAFKNTQLFSTFHDNEIFYLSDADKKNYALDKAYVSLKVLNEGSNAVFSEIANANQNINVEYSNGSYFVEFKDINIKNIKLSARLILIEKAFVFQPTLKTVKDQEGNIFPIIKIGEQTWMAKNLSVSHYSNGDPISTISIIEDISDQTNPKYYWPFQFGINIQSVNSTNIYLKEMEEQGAGNYNLSTLLSAGILSNEIYDEIIQNFKNFGISNETINTLSVTNIKNFQNDLLAESQDISVILQSIGGYFYTYQAIMDSRGICPKGWHIPSKAEWEILYNHLGGSTLAGGHLKYVANNSTDYKAWLNPNVGASNSSRFYAIPFDYRSPDGKSLPYNSKEKFLFATAAYWTSSKYDDNNSWFVELVNNSSSVFMKYNTNNTGFCVRCIQD